jgi:type IV secretion system protein TrbG
MSPRRRGEDTASFEPSAPFMTDDDRTPKPTPRLDGPEGLLTAEWTIPDFPGLEPEAVEPPTTPGDRGTPKPPSRRRAEIAAAARPGAAGSKPHRRFTFPRPPQPAADPAPAVVINNLDATLPPRAEREAAGPLGEQRSARDLEPRRGRIYAALGALAVCTFGYAFWATALRPSLAGATRERGLPQFLQAAPPAADVESPAAAPPAAAPSPPPSALPLPPALAATLAQALPPPIPQPTPTADVPADAGAPAVTASVEEQPQPAPHPVSPDIRERAAALRATLVARRPDTTKKATPSKARAARAAAPRHADPIPGLVVEWSSDDAPSSLVPPPSAKPPPASPAPPSVLAAVAPLTTYTYADKALFAVVTAPMRVTDLVLERGETLLSQPTAGDAARWVIRVVPTGEQTHVFVQPLRHPLRTNLTLTTTRRTYFLELSTRDDGSYMAGVAWTYPRDEAERRRAALAQAERERKSTTAISDLQALRFDYRVDVTAGSPAWKPNLVFDDGVHTFIRFPRPVAAAQAPVLFILRSKTTRDAKYVNYRVKGDLYVVERLIDAAELRLANSDDEQDIVRISRKP